MVRGRLAQRHGERLIGDLSTEACCSWARARRWRGSSSGTASMSGEHGEHLSYSWLRIVGSVIFVSSASIIALLRITASIRSPSYGR